MPDDGTPTGSETPPNTPPGDGAGTDDEGEPFDLDRAKATIAKLRGIEKDAKAKDKQIAQLSAKIQDFEKSQLSETEKVQARVKELEAEREDLLRERRTYAAKEVAMSEAEKLKAKSPLRVFKLIQADIEYDDDGKPTNIAALIKEVQKDVPELFLSQNGSADGGAGNGRTPSGFDMNDAIRRATGRA